MNDADLVPIHLEFVGEDAGERRADMLAHLGADDVDGDLPIAVDANQMVGSKSGLPSANGTPPGTAGSIAASASRGNPKAALAPAMTTRKPRRVSALWRTHRV